MVSFFSKGISGKAGPATGRERESQVDFEVASHLGICDSVE